jgi:hypothetical protein
MDGLRRGDEWRAFAAELPAETTVFRRRGGLEEFRRSPAALAAPNPDEVERLLLSIDGRSSVRRVIDLSRLGTFLGMRVLVELARAGWIEPIRAETREATSDRPRPLRAWAARVGPFAALSALAALALAGSGPAGAPGPDGAIAQARACFEAVRVRHLVLAERLASGHWPASLDALPAWPDGEGRALTPAEASAYYLVQRADQPSPSPASGDSGRDSDGEGGELVVLAPER